MQGILTVNTALVISSSQFLLYVDIESQLVVVCSGKSLEFSQHSTGCQTKGLFQVGSSQDFAIFHVLVMTRNSGIKTGIVGFFPCCCTFTWAVPLSLVKNVLSFHLGSCLDTHRIVLGVGMRSRCFVCEVFLWFLWFVCLELFYLCLFVPSGENKEEPFTLTMGIMMQL